MIKILTDTGKSIAIDADINYNMNNPLFSTNNDYSFPFAVPRSEELDQFFNYLSHITNIDNSVRKINATIQHKLLSLDGTLYMEEAGEQYVFHFSSPRFWDTAKNNKLSTLLSSFMQTFASRSALKDTWDDSGDIVFSPIKNPIFTKEWPVNISHTGIINDPSAFDDDTKSALFVPFLTLDAVLRNSVAQAGASISLNELSQLPDYNKILLWNNYAINEFSTAENNSAEQSMPLVYLDLNHHGSAHHELRILKGMLNTDDQFFVRGLNEIEDAFPFPELNDLLNNSITPTAIVKTDNTVLEFEINALNYYHPFFTGFVEKSNRLADIFIDDNNPAICHNIYNIPHKLQTGDHIFMANNQEIKFNRQVFEVTVINDCYFSIPIDGSTFAENPNISIAGMNMGDALPGGAGIVHTYVGAAAPDYIKPKHNLVTGNLIYISSPFYSVNGNYLVTVIDDWSFRIDIESITVNPLASKGSFVMYNIISGDCSIFKININAFTITAIKNTNPCEVVFKETHYLKDSEIIKFHNTGIALLDGKEFIISAKDETTISLNDIDGSNFTGFNYIPTTITNYHPDDSSSETHPNAPVIAYAERMKLNASLNLAVNYSNHVPDITLDELIKAVENKFACKFVYNTFNNEIKIRLLDNVTKTHALKDDITTQCTRGGKVLFEPTDGFIIDDTNPEGDEYYSTLLPVIDTTKVTFKPNVFNVSLLPTVGNTVNDIRLVTNTMLLYIFTASFNGDAGWKKLGVNVLPVRSGKEEYKSESKLSTFMEDAGQCRTDQIGTCKSYAPWITAKPSTSLFFFNNPTNNPHSSNGLTNSNNAISLFAAGEKGLYATLFAKYIYWYTHVRKHTDRVVEWEKESITNFEYTDKFKISDFNAYVKSISLLLKSDGNIEWGITELLKA